MSVYRVRTPSLLAHPQVLEFLKEAFGAVHHAAPDEAVGALAGMVRSPATGLFLGFEDEAVKAVGLMLLPETRLLGVPQAALMYNRGKPSLRREVVAAGVAFISRHGHTKYWAINRSGHRDEAWARVAAQGRPWRKVGSVVEIDVNE